MDEVFKAINDPGRRILLDKLFEHDGQSLGELCEHLPGMTRYGVMNHLSASSRRRIWFRPSNGADRSTTT